MKDVGLLLGEKGRDEEERRSADAKRSEETTRREERRGERTKFLHAEETKVSFRVSERRLVRVKLELTSSKSGRSLR